jgi:thiol-disulfide isomerase/thioredoxin
MKKTLLLLVTFVIISCSNAQKTEFSKEALSENLLATDGSQVAFKDILKKHQGKTVVIEVWASWCGDCVKVMPKIKELQANNPDVAYVFISMDKTADKCGKPELKNTNSQAIILWRTTKWKAFLPKPSI